MFKMDKDDVEDGQEIEYSDEVEGDGPETEYSDAVKADGQEIENLDGKRRWTKKQILR